MAGIDLNCDPSEGQQHICFIHLACGDRKNCGGVARLVGNRKVVEHYVEVGSGQRRRNWQDHICHCVGFGEIGINRKQEVKGAKCCAQPSAVRGGNQWVPANDTHRADVVATDRIGGVNFLG